MAKWGEGDPRWIVEERPDSTNVNNWHWTERDASAWSKTKMKALFSELKHDSEEGSWKIKEVKSLEGEATINNRKGKLIYFYDWSVKLEYTGSLPGSESEHTGTIEVPNLSDENDADDLDIQVLSKSDANNARKLKDLVRKTGREPMRGLCMKYVTDMKTEYSSGMVLPTKNVNNTPKVKETTSKQAPNEQMKNVKLTDNNKHKNIVHVELKLTEEFKTTADELYATLTRPERICAFTRCPPDVDATPGGKFSIMGGNITGEFVELEKDKKIVQKWRFREWPHGVYSTVTMNLIQKSDCTTLNLIQTGVPDYDTDRTETGWRQHYWGPIKQVFGFGAQLF